MAQADPQKAFLGVGWAFPVQVEADGKISEASYEEDIRQAIRIILGTNSGERVMRPDFGAVLSAFIFEPVSATTMSLVQARVQRALIEWEPRIDMQKLTVTSDPAEGNKLQIDLTYLVRATNTLSNLVYPFYLQEG